MIIYRDISYNHDSFPYYFDENTSKSFDLVVTNGYYHLTPFQLKELKSEFNISYKDMFLVFNSVASQLDEVVDDAEVAVNNSSDNIDKCKQELVVCVNQDELLDTSLYYLTKDVAIKVGFVDDTLDGDYYQLSSLELDDGATFAPHQYDVNFLFIGDSITQGWASKYDSLSYAWRVTRHFNARTVNQGIGGAYFHEDCFDRIDFTPDVVFVAYGTNDFGRYKTYDEFRAHAAAHLRLIADEYRHAKIFVISPIWRDKRDGKSMGTFEGCCAIVEQEAEALELIHIDGLDLVPPIPEFFGDAYLHPNDEGFSLYAENLIVKLEKYL